MISADLLALSRLSGLRTVRPGCSVCLRALVVILAVVVIAGASRSADAGGCEDVCSATAYVAQTLLLIQAQEQQDLIDLAYQAALTLCGQDVACQNAAAIVAQAASDALAITVNAGLAAIATAFYACMALCGG